MYFNMWHFYLLVLFPANMSEFEININFSNLFSGLSPVWRTVAAMALSVNAKKGLVFGIGAALVVIGCVIGGVWLVIVASILEGVSVTM